TLRITLWSGRRRIPASATVRVCGLRPRTRSLRSLVVRARGGVPGRVENPHDAHYAGAAVLDAVDQLRREMEARARPERDVLVADMRDAFPLDDVADLVVGVAVVGCPARLDDADELRRLGAAGLRVDEGAQRTIGVRPVLRLVAEADDDLALRSRCMFGRHQHRHD